MCNISYLSKLTAVFVCTMSDTEKSRGKQPMEENIEEGEKLKIWQLIPHDGPDFRIESLEAMELPEGCNTIDDVMEQLPLCEKVLAFDFAEGLELQTVAHQRGITVHMPFNFYGSTICGQATSGTVYLACSCNGKLVNMDKFFDIVNESEFEHKLKHYEHGKRFPGVEGDILHRLWRMQRQEQRKEQEKRELEEKRQRKEKRQLEAAAPGSRRTNRARQPKQIFDPSHEKRVKREPKGD